MTLTPWTHENAFLPGTIVRADAMNLKLDGIAQAIQAICNQINQKIPNLPATFTGETQIPEKTLPNTLLLINSAGAMDLYPKAQFDTDVANAASAAVQAATSATNAQNSASQAQVHEQNAEERAEAAFNSATAAAAFAESAEQAKDDTMSALNTRLGTTGNLGTAAQRNVMTSLTDATTPNALMPRGVFGVGNTAGVLISDANALNATGFYQGSATWIGSPTPGADGSNQGTIIHIQWGSSNAYAVQYFFPINVAFAPRVRRKDDNVWSAWRLEYNQANIIGTVSQSGATPTGAIIESGSNANGSYVRYADGTQECYGGLISTPSAQTWSFPAAFVSGTVIVQGCSAGGASNAFFVAVNPPGVSAVTLGLIRSDTATFAGSGIPLGLSAKGRWY